MLVSNDTVLQRLREFGEMLQNVRLARELQHLSDDEGCGAVTVHLFLHDELGELYG